MADQFVSEIRMFGCNFAPTGWAQCNGQLMPISQNTALFSLLGTNFGGNGTSTFGLPNLQGSGPINQGQGAGLTNRVIGETGGVSNVTLLSTEMPAHSHLLTSRIGGTVSDPSNEILASPAGRPGPNYFSNTITTPTALNATAIGIAGGSLPHNNLMPYLVVNFCIALQGIFPARN